MSIQYPHKLLYKASSAPTKDANGNWVNPSTGGNYINATALEADCRDTPSDEGNQTTIVDGEVINYGSIVYCELDIPDLKRGDLVKVFQGINVRLEGQVKRFSRDSFHCRIWV